MAEDNKKLDKTEEVPHEAERRILDAAEVLFASKGYASTSIRDITSQADCNVAAINYYFGSKKGLYEAVLNRYLQYLKDVRVEAIMEVVKRGYTIEDLLHNFSRVFVGSLDGVSGNRSAMFIVIRECLDPVAGGAAGIFDNFVDVRVQMVQAIKNLYPKATEENIMLCLMALVGHLWHLSQMLLYASQIAGDGEHVPAKNGPQLGDLNMDHAIDMFVKFTASGIERILGEEEK